MASWQQRLLTYRSFLVSGREEIMNIHAALRLIQVACDHQDSYNDYSRKLLLNGIYELADSCIESIQERDDREKYEHAQSEIQLIKDFAEKGLNSGDLATAFIHIADASQRAIPLPEEPHAHPDGG
jgi:hypothetical protein